MADKPDDTKKTEDKRNAEIFTEYQTLLSQSQDELSIVKALCAKYSVDQVALGEIVTEGRKNPPKAAAAPPKPEPPKSPIQNQVQPKG